MTIERAQLEKIAKLARLQLDDDELDRLTHDCRLILDYFETVRALTSTLAGGDDASTPLREDRVSPDRLSGSPADIAPSWRDGFFILPRLPALDPGGLDAGGTGGSEPAADAYRADALDRGAPDPDAGDAG